MGTILGKMSRLSLSGDSPQNDSVEECDPAVENENLNTPIKNFIADNLLDPRSATIGIRRTPIILAKVENETPLKGKPYLETDLDEEAVEAEETDILKENEESTADIDQSLLAICDCSLSSNEDENVFHEEEPVLSNINTEIITDDDEIITVEGKIVNSPAINKIKKTVIYEDNSPMLDSTPVKPKGGRTPLGLVSTNSSPIPSPLGGKHWRGIREERIKLGLENTPPGAEPFLATVQSAPGKVGARRATKKIFPRTAWAQDETLII